MGSVLPDLLSLYNRRLRPRALTELWAEKPSADDDEIGHLLTGMAFHHEVDVHFHRAPLFTEASTELRRALTAASDTPGLKRFLPAHVLTELLLDHLALARDPDCAQRFHEDLAAGAADIKALVSPHPLGDEKKFGALLEHVLVDRFVDGYRTVEGVLGRMNRILPRFGQRVMEPAEHEAVEAWFREAAPVMDARLTEFVTAMAGRISQPESWAGETSKKDAPAEGGRSEGGGVEESEAEKSRAGNAESNVNDPDLAPQPV